MLIKYISSDGTVIIFNRAPEYRILKIGDLRNYSRAYKKVGNHFIFTMNEIRGYEIEINCIPDNPDDCPKDKEFILTTFENDCKRGKLGKLYINDCFIHCNIFSQTVNPVSEVKGILSTKCRLVAKNGWFKENQFEFYGNSNNELQTYQKITDLPFDLRRSSNQGLFLNNENIEPLSVKIQFEAIHETVDNPTINIGINTYKVNTDLKPYEKIEINPIERKVIKINKSNGVEENIFFSADRNSYIFSRIQKGEHNVSINEGLKATVILLEERVCPEWI